MLCVWGSDFDIPSIEPTSLAAITFHRFVRSSLRVVYTCSTSRSPLPYVSEGGKRNHWVTEAVLARNESCESTAFMELVDRAVAPAVLHSFWMSNPKDTQLVRTAYARLAGIPWSFISPLEEKRSAERRVKNAKQAQLRRECTVALDALNTRLGSHQFFFDQPCELDAIVFGWVACALAFPLSDQWLSSTVASHHALVAFAQRIAHTYFPELRGAFDGGWAADGTAPRPILEELRAYSSPMKPIQSPASRTPGRRREREQDEPDEPPKKTSDDEWRAAKRFVGIGVGLVALYALVLNTNTEVGVDPIEEERKFIFQ